MQLRSEVSSILAPYEIDFPRISDSEPCFCRVAFTNSKRILTPVTCALAETWNAGPNGEEFQRICETCCDSGILWMTWALSKATRWASTGETGTESVSQVIPRFHTFEQIWHLHRTYSLWTDIMFQWPGWLWDADEHTFKSNKNPSCQSRDMHIFVELPCSVWPTLAPLPTPAPLSKTVCPTVCKSRLMESYGFGERVASHKSTEFLQICFFSVERWKALQADGQGWFSWHLVFHTEPFTSFHFFQCRHLHEIWRYDFALWFIISGPKLTQDGAGSI